MNLGTLLERLYKMVSIYDSFLFGECELRIFMDLLDFQLYFLLFMFKHASTVKRENIEENNKRCMELRNARYGENFSDNLESCFCFSFFQKNRCFVLLDTLIKKKTPRKSLEMSSPKEIARFSLETLLSRTSMVTSSFWIVWVTLSDGEARMYRQPK